MKTPNARWCFALLLLFAVPLIGCGGGEDGDVLNTPDGGAGASGQAGSGGASGASGSGGSGGTSQGAALDIVALKTVQTHVLPDSKVSWMLQDVPHELHLVGQRSFMALIELGAEGSPAPESPMLEVMLDGATLGSIPLGTPAALPPTEANGPALATNLYSATVDGAWVKPGLSLRVTASNRSPSATRSLVVGADSVMDMWTLPFYLFGANDQNSPAIALTAKPDETSTTELYQKWAIGKVNFTQHPASRVDWPSIIVGPRDGNPAMQVSNANEQLDGFAVMSAVLGILGAIRNANGESSTNNQYYAPLLMLDAQGVYYPPGGGLGGGSRGTGDYDYAGIFIHEQGHAFGMPHAGEAYDAGTYPYAGGSLLGSVWGYDASRGWSFSVTGRVIVA